MDSPAAGAPARPLPPERAHEGFVWVARVDREWRVLTQRVRPGCRAGANGHTRACGAPAVAALQRGTKRPMWWSYCAAHMYGRWVEAGQVMCWALEPATKPAPEVSHG